MVKKLHFPISFFALLIIFFCPKEILAQCAGNDNTMLTICDIANPASQTINLFAQLGGTPTAGGTWKDDDKSGGLDKITGVLNAQQILKSGIYHYTYTVSNVSGCVDNTATITVTIGGYTGVPAPNSSICSSETTYNLFQVFNGNFPAPQIGGTWIDNDGSGGLNPATGVLNASDPIPDDTYSYTYTIPAIGSCAAPTPSTVYVSIYRSPKPGIPTNLQLCSDQLASYTNVDLNDQLADEDIDGIWTESGTTEISNETDSFIDIQNIYNTKGPGTYNFTYNVKSNNTVCKDLSSTVRITIEKQLDFTGAKIDVIDNICEDVITPTIWANLFQGAQNIPDGAYKVTYTITGVSLPITTTQNFIGGKMQLPISSSNFPGVGSYTITVTNIVSTTSLGICTNIIGPISDVLNINPIPKINNATLAIAPICKTFDAMVDFSGTSNLTDGNYNIIYNLSGSNTGTALTAVLAISGGLGTFIVPKNLIPNVGTSTVTITKITNSSTGCTNTAALSKSFTINPLPDASNLTATIKNICQGQTANVKLSGLGTLTSISIDYILSGTNSSGSQTIPLPAVGGETNFNIPISDLPNVGLTTFTMTKLTNTTTGCSSAINIKTDFTVNPIPNIPVANDQKFCTSDNAKISNLIPQGNQYQWFDSATSTIPLSSTTPLVSGNYFVKEVNTTTGCESPLKTINVIINTTPQINNATLAIASICQGYPANVNFSGNSNLTDGDYNILYNLTGSNSSIAIPATLNITAGLATFSIAPNLIPNPGNTTITITNITNNLTLCTNTSTLSKSFTVNAIPDVSNMAVTANNACLGQPANITITGLATLTNISLTYSVSGANTISTQTIPLVVSSGNASFSIPASNLLNTGSNTLVINNITNAGNGCSSIINSVSKNFTINSIPNSPTASNQKFCETDLATVTNLVPNGNQYKWYDTATSTTPLSADKLLVTKNYFVKESNAAGCESLANTISVQINTVPVPVLKANGNEFCGINKPTILNLSNNTNASTNLTWYDAQSNGTMLPNTHLLEEGSTYYGFDYDATTKCYSSPLQTIITLTNCTVTPDGLKIPDGFSPNGDGVNDTFQITDIEFSFPNYTLEIFNRYGNIMFKGDNNKPAWDGKNSNSSFISGDAPTGVYFYIIHYNKDNLPPRQGQLYLNR